jgi:hypothetical protein
MQLHEPTLERLFSEAEEARLREALLEATGDDLLDGARAFSLTVEQRVRRLTGQARPRRKERPNA